MSDAVLLTAAHGRAVVQPTCGQLTELALRAPDGRWIRPLAVPPWPAEGHESSVPPHLHRLGGEFFCLPFGGAGELRNPTPGWEGFARPSDTPLHGRAANDPWEVIESTGHAVTLALQMPEPSPVSRLIRRIHLDEFCPRVAISVTIEPRRDGRVPAAFHPIFRLPLEPGGLRIDADFDCGFTSPGTLTPNLMVTKPGMRFDKLDAVPSRHREACDLSRLPFSQPIEDVVLMAGVTRPIRISFADDDTALVLDWSRAHLPHCMLWLHDRAIASPPWGNRFRGLGLEPLAAAFDGPWQLSAGANPLTAAGYVTAVPLQAGRHVMLALSLTLAAS